MHSQVVNVLTTIVIYVIYKVMNTSTTKICSFFGHREVNLTKSEIIKLKDLIITLVKEKGFNIFLFGGFGEFDALCLKLVTELKEEYPNIKRIYCLENEKYLKKKYKLNNFYDEVIYLPVDFDYWYTRIYYRNIEIIKHSDLIVFYAEERKDSGAYKALKFAKSIKKPFINIY
ncbi:MAG: hypothetical protein J6C13_00610 [Clostridia bacterium]|nr:hypothetical protein [Clostridia bacterium]